MTDIRMSSGFPPVFNTLVKVKGWPLLGNLDVNGTQAPLAWRCGIGSYYSVQSITVLQQERPEPAPAIEQARGSGVGPGGGSG